MNSPIDSQFLHRACTDGTFESICKECFKTVAKVGKETDLHTHEETHACDPWTRSPAWRKAIRNYFGQ